MDFVWDSKKRIRASRTSIGSVDSESFQSMRMAFPRVPVKAVSRRNLLGAKSNAREFLFWALGSVGHIANERALYFNTFQG